MKIVKDMRTMKSNLDKNKVVLGLSGGVDSTAAALLLKEKGYSVTGLYFNVLGEGCLNQAERTESAVAKAKKAAEQLGIDFVYRDMSKEFDEIVIEDFCREYASGHTPNPCIICNPAIKFKVLRDVADDIGAMWIATGHYAGTRFDSERGIWHITRGKNRIKDQSYMLYRLDQETISRLLLPLNQYEDKGLVRDIARRGGAENADDRDSQEICFIDSDDDYCSFMKRRGVVCEEGDFVHGEGNVVGTHKGICNYTIGQRKGLGIALGKPAFVTRIDPLSNTVHLGDNEELFTKRVHCQKACFSAPATGFTIKDLCDTYDKKEVTAKIRYAAKPSAGILRVTAAEDGTDENIDVAVDFFDAQRAVTPGQSVVFYRGDDVIGGGFIR